MRPGTRTGLRAAIAVGVLGLAAVPAAQAGVKISGVDATSFPRIRLSVVTSQPSAKPPALRENDRPVAGLESHNLASGKALVLAIDRSKSMAGGPFANAIDAARSFASWKAPRDRIAVVGFGSSSERPGRFTATADGLRRRLRA